MLQKWTRGLVVALALLVGGTAYGQGVQTGVLTGTVTDSDGLVLPGVTVTVSSAALQGVRTTVTDGNGVYSLRGLPPGEYTLAFELSGMRTVEATQRVDLGLTARVDARLQLATLTETVTVTAELPTLVTTTSGGANYRAEEINVLATARTVQGIANLAPGLTDNTPNAGQVTISGSFAFDNQFLVDGVDVADNLFGTANNLFIEDAIEEVQVLTSGISAEFGRFSGGVVNAVTKSGGNTFSGSFRDSIYKPEWTEETPFETERNQTREGDLQHVYEWTVGGPILRDRLWFFHAGRRQESTTPAPFPDTGIDFSRVNENTRFEIKGTATPIQNQTFTGTYLRNTTSQTQPTFGFSVDPSTVVNRTLPNDLWVGAWRGVINNQLFATAQVSRRTFGFRDSGGTSTAIIDSPFLTRGVTPGVTPTRHYNAPYFDSTDPENRNNRQIAASVAYFATTPSLGSHDIKVGYENFQTTRTGGNSQTATNYVFATDYLVSGTTIVLDANQKPIPVFAPGLSRIENWIATRGAEINITTQSFYLHDRWVANNRMTLDLGVRYERVRSEATGGIVGIDTDTIAPRLGATWDVMGDGRQTVQATYARYAGKYSETQAARNTNVGVPNLLLYEYTGPAGQGLNFAPAFDLSNYRVIGGSFPLENIFMADGLSSAVSDEITVSYGRQIGTRGAAKVTYQRRSMSNFIETFINDPSANGKVTVIQSGINFGQFDKTLNDNTSDLKRDYQAVILQSNYRLTNQWSVNAHWTLQLENDGTIEGEGTNTPGAASIFGTYPEIYTAGYARNIPDGRLDDFQQHKVRAWTTYAWDFGRFGSADTSLLWRYNSAATFSLVATVPTSAIQRARNPGYARPPQSQPLFFDERGSEEYEPSSLFDLSVTYQVPVFRTLRPWIKLDLFNAFNDQSLVRFNTAITANNAGPVDADGLPLDFNRGASFGKATAISHFPQTAATASGDALYARTFMVSFGLRF
ncbi:MAG: TonB-dependent receptor [Vicinamibacterales bacterium]|nr:TonB-dependent receptor [Vicinamibacterales bacterium]